jgi:glycosyltransferase involved in cell wall biosynthesis
MRQDLPGKVWIQDTVTREELYRLFDRANVLVFPTLVEGLALTPLQAMARALPVITTPNSGADFFIRDGENGRLIAPADHDVLSSTLAWAIRHPEILREMGFRAAQRMAQWQWDHYRAALGKLVTDFLINSDMEKRMVSCDTGN